ncbi:MAG: two-component regulator propeller domain-containing protein, partial [Flavobacteriales bacterium]
MREPRGGSITPGRARALLACICALAIGGTQAQRYFFENISNQQGLPAVKVFCAAQGPDGIIWIGTESGLASYDGISVAGFGTADGTAEGGVFSMLVDRAGSLWAGHLDGGITWSDGRVFRACSLGRGASSPVTAWVEERDGSILVATMGAGLWRIAGAPSADGGLHAQRLPTGQDHILTIAKLPDGRIGLVSGKGDLQAWDGNAVSGLGIPGMPDLFKSTALFVDSKGMIWVGTQGGGAFRCDANGRCDRFDILSGLGSNTIYCFGEDDEGQVWIGTTDGGVGCVAGNVLRAYRPENGLHSLAIRCLVRDREGNMIIGTYESGLDIFKGDGFVSYGESEGLSDPKVFAVMEDRGRQVWFGTNAGIVVLDREGRLAKRITAQNGQLTSNFVRCLREDDKGHVWVGTEGGGLLRYDPRSGRSQEALEVSGSLADLRVTALEQGQPGELWVGGVNGLWRYLPGSSTVPTHYSERDGLAGKHVIALFRDRDGTIWVGSKSSGITRMNNGEAHRIDLGRAFSAACFTQDREGRIWVGTEGQGIIVLRNGKEEQRFTTEQGLLSNVIKAITADARGNVWIGTTKGLNLWRHQQQGFIAFTERAGFTGIEVKPNATCALRDGSVLFGTVNGATRVGIKAKAERSPPPLVTIRDWMVNLEQRPLAPETDLRHNERSIRVRYGCVSLSDPNAVRYAYRLDGLEDDWQPMTASTVAAYPALPPGSYVFQVKAMDH